MPCSIETDSGSQSVTASQSQVLGSQSVTASQSHELAHHPDSADDHFNLIRESVHVAVKNALERALVGDLELTVTSAKSKIPIINLHSQAPDASIVSLLGAVLAGFQLFYGFVCIFLFSVYVATVGVDETLGFVLNFEEINEGDDSYDRRASVQNITVVALAGVILISGFALQWRILTGALRDYRTPTPLGDQTRKDKQNMKTVTADKPG